MSKAKDELKEDITEEDKIEPFSDKLDVYKHLSEVHSRIKKDVGTDFILAKLGDKDKEFVNEMTVNAYFIKQMVLTMKLAIDKPREDWTQKKKDEYKKISDTVDTIAKTCFDSCIHKVYMVIILNRNVPKNHMIRLMAGLPDEEPESKFEMEDKATGGFFDKLAQTITGKRKKRQDIDA